MATGKFASSGGGQSGGGRVTLRTLARHLDLSVTTVSRALKRGDDVNSGTIEKVETAARLLGYRPHQGGINLRTGRTQAIGVILPLERPGEVSNVVASLIEGIAAFLKTAGYRTNVVPLFRDDDPLAALQDLIEDNAVDGVILTNTRPKDDRVRALMEAGFPFATFGRTEGLGAHPFVDIDHQRIGAEAARLLIEAGHRQPVLVAPPADLTYSLQFAAGWHSVIPAASEILFTAGTPQSGRDLAVELLRTWPGTTGAFVASEEAALGFVAGLAADGRSIGRDFAALTYGGSKLHSFLNPPLSAFIYPHFKIGERLAEFLVRSIGGEDAAGLGEVVDASFVDFGSQRLG